MRKQIVLIVSISLAAAFLVGFFTYTGYSNDEIRLKNSIAAQQSVLSSYYDRMWKIISQKAQVADKYKESFKDVYSDIMDGRYANDGGGALMKWIQESNPNFDASIYKDLSASIESERAAFFQEQKKLIDLNQTHHTIRETFPGSLFIGGRPDVQVHYITSSHTAAVDSTGKDDDIQVFSNPSK